MNERLTPKQRSLVAKSVSKALSSLARGLIGASLIISVTAVVVLVAWWDVLPWWARLLIGGVGGYYAVTLIQAAQVLALSRTLDSRGPAR